MALDTVGRGNWSARVRFADGDDGFAYVPNVLLIEVGANPAEVRAVVPGAFPEPSDGERVDTEGRLPAPQRPPRRDEDGRVAEPPEPPDVDLGEPVVDEDDDDEDETARAVDDQWAGDPNVAGGFRLWRYVGEVVSAVRRLRGAGIDAQPVHVFFADAGPGLGANPVYGHPVYGHPVTGNPVYGHPVTANPVYGHPVYGHPVYGHPVYGHAGADGSAMAAPPCCCDADPCECPTTPPSPPASSVYPNPCYVATAYSEGEGGTYRVTGQRRSQARPLIGLDDVELQLGEIAKWRASRVRIAVLDTGRPACEGAKTVPDRVADVLANIVGNPDDGPDSDEDDYLDPVAGHGTFIAGLLARVAPGCGVMVEPVLSNYGDGHELAIAQAIDTLARRRKHCRPHIISLSFGGYVLEHARCLHNAIRRAMRNGIVVVASAGNDGVSRKSYPGAFEGVVSVAALGPDGPAPFSNWGSWVRACAPGVDVASTFYEYELGRERKRYGLDPDDFAGFATWSGTSFAAPIVAGVLARLMLDRGVKANAAVEAVIDQAGLFRLRCYGTVVNTLAVRPLCP